MKRWRRVVDWLFPLPDPDDDDLLPRPDPPVEEPSVRLARASTALNAAMNEWAKAVAALAARRLDR